MEAEFSPEPVLTPDQEFSIAEALSRGFGRPITEAELEAALKWARSTTISFHCLHLVWDGLVVMSGPASDENFRLFAAEFKPPIGSTE